MLQLLPDGSHRVIVLGNRIEQDESPQVIVPRGIWQGARLAAGGEWALLGTTVAPAFDYADYEDGNREELTRAYPACAEMIEKLTEEPA
jgi:predicted cupin superfamily sugar epimerase